MHHLSKQEARKVILASQLLKRPSVAGQSAKRLAKETIGRIGYIQIDTISVVERAHHHVFWSRLPTYRPALLSKLEHEKVLFEYWSHAASYLPMHDFRFSLPMKEDIRSKDRFWFEKDAKVMQHVLDRITAEGPLMSKDFEKPEGFKVTAMWEAAPTKRALQNLFMEGQIMVKSRQGFQKVYDLTERIIPDDLDTSMPTREEYIRYLIKRDIQAHGIISTKEMGYLLKGHQQEIREQAQVLEEMGSIERCEVRGTDTTYFTTPGLLDVLNLRLSQQVKILSPFDNVLINRGRTQDLFNFDYVLECYVPAPKRVFGYFGLPILWKNNLVGQIDVKVNRSNDLLEVRNLALHLRTINDEFVAAWCKTLKQFMDFQGVDSVDFRNHRSELGEELLGVLFSQE